MQIQMESTPQIMELDGVPCRPWEGVTAAGVRCVVFVHRIIVHNSADQSQFDQELREQRPWRRSVPELPEALDTFARSTEGC